MPTQVQFRRGTTGQNNTFTGAEGELTIDTSTWSIRIHDGSTAGGHPVSGGGGGGSSSDIAGGAAGDIPYQIATSSTGFISIGAADTVLTSNGSTATWVSLGTLTAAGGVNADNLLVNSITSGDRYLVVTDQTGAYTGLEASTLTIYNSTVGLTVKNTATIGGHLLPETTAVYDLGSSSKRWRTLYITSSTIDIAGSTLTADGSTLYFNNQKVMTGTPSGNLTVTNLVITGDLTVSGTSTFVNSTVTNVSDPIFGIGGGLNGAAPASDDNKDRGIAFQWHNGSGAKKGFFGFDDSTGYFTFVPDATITNEVVSGSQGDFQASNFRGNLIGNVTGDLTGVASTATNLAGGAAGGIPYQSAAGATTFLSIGTNGFVLTSNGSAPTWQAISGLSAGSATTATNLAGGSAGQIPMQLASGSTSFIGAGTSGQFLQAGTNTATFVSTSSMYVNSAVNAEKWATARTITLGGDLSGSMVLDGSQNVTLTATVAIDTVALGTDTTGIYVAEGATSGFGLSGSASAEGSTFTVTANSTSANTVSTIVYRDASGNFSAGTVTATNLAVSASTNSTSTTTGALQINNGGAGIGGNVYVGGVVNSSQGIYNSGMLTTAYLVNAPANMALKGTGSLSTVSSVSASSVNDISVTPNGRFVYSANSGDNTIGAYTLNTTTGVLTNIAYYPASSTRCVVVHPNGKFVYGGGSSGSGVTITPFTINQATGALTTGTVISQLNLGGSAQPNVMKIHPSGRFLYSANGNANCVTQYSINQSTGALTTLTNAISVGNNASAMAMDPTGRFLYVKNQSDGTISQLAIDQTTGYLSTATTALSRVWTDMTFDPSGRYAFVNSSSDIYTYSINQTTGALTQVFSLYMGSAGSQRFVIDPLGRYLYGSTVLSSVYSTITLEINQLDGSLRITGHSVRLSSNPDTIAIDPSGRFLFMGTSFSENLIKVFAINNFSAGQAVISAAVDATSTQTGALQVVGGLGVGAAGYFGGNVTAPAFIGAVTGTATTATNVAGGAAGQLAIQSGAGTTAFVPVGTSGQFLQAGTNTATFVSTSSMYVNSAVNAEKWLTARTFTFGGDLTGSMVVNGSQDVTFTATIAANSVALGTDTTGDYVSNGATSGFGLSGSTTGESQTFTVTANSTSANTVSTIVYRDASGNFSAGVVTATNLTVSTSTNATSTATGALQVVNGGAGIGGDVYVGGSLFTNRFLASSYRPVAPSDSVYQGNGSINTQTTVSANTVINLQVHPNGRFVYGVNYTANIGVYSINTTTGALTLLQNAAPGLNQFSIRGVAVNPSGNCLVVTNYGSSSITPYTINQSTGILTTGTTVAAGSSPRDLTIDPSGRFVYVVNQSDNTVSQYTINATSGVLTTITNAISCGTGPYNVSVDATGRFAYAINYLSNNITQYTINQSTGALTSTTNFSPGFGPQYSVADPSGRFLYVCGGSRVASYSINQSTGVLTQISVNIMSSTSLEYLTTDPNGRYVYASNAASSGFLEVLSVNPVNGALTPVSRTYIANTMYMGSIEPTGRFLYVGQTNNIYTLAINNFSAGQAVISAAVDATSTQTGALQVAGGLGVGAAGYFGGNVTAPAFIGAVTGTATTATNVAGGAAGQLHIQSAAGTTAFVPVGTSGQFLQAGTNTATFVSTSSMYVNSAVNAEKWITARTFTFGGDLSGSMVVDGSQNVTFTATIAADSVALGTDTTGNYVGTGATSGFGLSGSASAEGATFTVTANSTSSNTANTIMYRDANGDFAAGGATFSRSVTFSEPVTFSGTATFVYSTNTVYTDNIINVHTPPGGGPTNHVWTTDDGKDIGFIFHYYKSATDRDAFLGFNNSTQFLEWFSNGSEGGGVYTGTTYGTFRTGSIRLQDTTTVNSTNSGALQVAGGVGINGGLFVGGVVTATSFSGSTANITAVTSATTTQTGALIVTGGLGVGNNIVAGGALFVGTPTGTVGAVGEIRATNEITAYYSSDQNLKENIQLISDPIEKLNQIRGVYFDWKDSFIDYRGGEDGYFVRKHDVGVIAQEVAKVLPEVVAHKSDGYMGVKYEKIIPLLIEAIKDQQRQITQLSEQVNKLVNK